MAKPKSKAKIIESIKTERKRLYRYFSKFTPEEIELPGVVGEWSVKDLHAHLTAWDQLFLAWYEGGMKGEKVELPAPGMTWAQMDELNQQMFEEHKNKSFDEVDAEARACYTRILETVERMPEDSLHEQGYFPWTGEDTLVYYLRECTDLHYKWAWECILRWMSDNPRFQPSKVELIGKILVERRRLEKNLAALTPEQMVVPGVVGEWSVKDIMAHLTAWEKLFLGWYDGGKRGEVPETPAPGYNWSNYSLLNERIYEENKHRSLEDVRKEFESHYQYTLERIRAIPEEEWFVKNLYEWMEDNVRIARYIQANTGNHYRWAKSMILKWLREKK